MRSKLFAAVFAMAGATIGGVALAARDTPEVAYQKLIAGKTAEKPIACIDTRLRSGSLTAYDDKLVYEISRKLVYVNNTSGGCQGVERGDTLVTRQYQPRLCRGDIATTVDTGSRTQTGSCSLGDFTPYRAR